MIEFFQVRFDSGVMFATQVFVGGFGMSAFLTLLAQRYALHRQLLDHPGQRRSHAVPTPRGGGIGPVLVMLAGGGMLAAIDAESRVSLLVCMFGLAAVAGIGWLDDHRPLPACLRLAVHLGAALALGIALIGAPDTPVRFAWIAASTIVVAGLVNAWNFMDGIDGIAASQASLVAGIVLLGSSFMGEWSNGAWLSGAWREFALVLFAATVGFLPFNFPRARIFLGDVGSGALGFAVAALLLRAVAAGTLSLPLALMPVSAFLVDAGMTLTQRFLRGRAWWRPHREHLYQWSVRSGYTHAQVTRCYALWTAVAGGIAIFTARLGPAIGATVSAGAILSGCLLWIWFRNHLWMSVRHRR